MQRTTVLRRKRRTNLFQMICFEIAVCVLFSAIGWLVVKSVRNGQMADSLLLGGANIETAGDADDLGDDETAAEAIDGSSTEEIAGADVLDADTDAAETEEEVPAVVDEGKQEEDIDLFTCVGTVTGMSMDGSLMTDISATFLMLHGIGQDDLVSVSVGEREYILPVEIDDPFPEFWGRTKLSCDPASNEMMIARNYQDFSMMEGYTDRVIGEKVRVRLLQSDAYQLRKMVKPKEVSLQAATNFRNVQTGALGERVLYRGHSPIFPDYGTVRCKFSDDFAWENQVKCIINLNQDDDEVEKAVYEKCPESYYRYVYDQGGVSAIELNGKHAVEAEFEEGIAAHMRFMLEHDGPYMIHCRMGKDRAGFFAALLEALEGSTYEEIGKDYAKSFQNYYGIQEGSWMDRYNQTDGADSFFAMMERGDTSKYLEDDGTLTRKAARTYLRKIGLSETEIDELQAKLAQDIPKE